MTHSYITQRFSHHPVLSRLAHESRWTISDKNKRPIDIKDLKILGEIHGARTTTEESLMKLEELLEFMPHAANTAYYLRAAFDRLCVIDIEPGCDPALRDKLLAIPHHYAERSMSGRGIHLVCDVPPSFDHTTPTVLKHPSGGFEILFEHWVTFTHNEITVPRTQHPESLDQLLITLLTRHRQHAARIHAKHIEIAEPPPNIPNSIIAAMTDKPLKKQLSDFPDPVREGDHSRYEFYVLSQLLYRLRNTQYWTLRKSGADPTDAKLYYNTSDEAHLMVAAFTRIVPHRQKHDEMRNNMPLVLNAACELLKSSPLEKTIDEIHAYERTLPQRSQRKEPNLDELSRIPSITADTVDLAGISSQPY